MLWGAKLEMQNKKLRKFYFICFSLYLATLNFTLAGMELFSGLLCVFSLFVLIKEKNFKAPPKAVIYPALALWATAVVGLWLNDVPFQFAQKSFFKFRWVIELILLTQLFREFFRGEDLKKVFPWLDGSILIVLLYSVYQFFYGHDFFRPDVTFRELGPGSTLFRPNGFFSLTLTLASVAGMYFCWSLARLLYKVNAEDSKAWLLNFAACAASLSIVILSFTRGSWIAITLAAMVIFAVFKIRLIRYFTPAVLIIFGILWYSFADFRVRIQSIDDPNYINNVERVNLWKGNWEIVKDYPVFGIGYNENIRRIQPYFIEMGIPKAYISHAHNNFLDFWAGTGTLGLFFYCAFILAIFIYSVNFYRSYRKRTDADPVVLSIALAFIGIQFVLHIAGMTECTFKDKELNHQYILFSALVLAFSQRFRLKTQSS